MNARLAPRTLLLERPVASACHRWHSARSCALRRIAFLRRFRPAARSSLETLKWARREITNGATRVHIQYGRREIKTTTPEKLVAGTSTCRIHFHTVSRHARGWRQNESEVIVSGSETQHEFGPECSTSRRRCPH